MVEIQENRDALLTTFLKHPIERYLMPGDFQDYLNVFLQLF